MNTKQIFKFWLLYYCSGLIGGYIVGAIPASIVGGLISYPLYQQHADAETIRAATSMPMSIAFYAIMPFWSFFCFRWVALKIVRRCEALSGVAATNI